MDVPFENLAETKVRPHELTNVTTGKRIVNLPVNERSRCVSSVSERDESVILDSNDRLLADDEGRLGFRTVVLGADIAEEGRVYEPDGDFRCRSRFFLRATKMRQAYDEALSLAFPLRCSRLMHLL